MNIFYTNSNPIKCANEHCYRHVVKMILEYTQMLSTAHHVLNGNNACEGLMKATHINHPCSVWVRRSEANYEWLYQCLSALHRIYYKKKGEWHLMPSVSE